MVNPLTLSPWLALIIGNSRLHWAYFEKNDLKTIWHTSHRQKPLNQNTFPLEILPDGLPVLPSSAIPLYIASVVPSQTAIWQVYPHSQVISLADLSLKGLYSTIGIDRALAVLGAGIKYGFPCLVIDGGTALTFTGVDSDRHLIGGAILPGLRLQFQTLATQTANLPQIDIPEQLPYPWALNTQQAIQSGIIYSILATLAKFITHWRNQYPESFIIFTGGDAERLLHYYQQGIITSLTRIIVDPQIIFEGIAICKHKGDTIAKGIKKIDC